MHPKRGISKAVASIVKEINGPTTYTALRYAKMRVVDGFPFILNLWVRWIAYNKTDPLPASCTVFKCDIPLHSIGL